jgi:hypothetical protein
MVTYEGRLEEERWEDFITDVTQTVKGYTGIHIGHISVKLPEWTVISPAPKQPEYEQNYTKIVGWKVLLPFPRLWYYLRKKTHGECPDKLSMEDFV